MPLSPSQADTLASLADRTAAGIPLAAVEAGAVRAWRSGADATQAATIDGLLGERAETTAAYAAGVARAERANLDHRGQVRP